MVCHVYQVYKVYKVYQVNKVSKVHITCFSMIALTCEKLESIFGRLVSADERSDDGGDTEEETKKQETKFL